MMNKTAEIHKAGYNCGLSIGLGNPVLFNFASKTRQKGIVIGYGINSMVIIIMLYFHKIK